MIIEEYETVGWQNSPSKSTPVSAGNLNQMDTGIEYNRTAIRAINDAINQVDLQTLAEVRTLHDDTSRLAAQAKTSQTSAASSEAKAKEYMQHTSEVADVDYATTSRAGIVKPDGTTIKIDAVGKVNVNETTSTTTASYNYGYSSANIKNVVSTDTAFADSATIASVLSSAYTSIATMIKNVYNNIASQINTMKVSHLGNFQLVNRGVIDGTLVANGTYFNLDPGAMYLLVANTTLNTTGAYRGMQAYAIGSAWGTGTSTTAQSVARVFALGSAGTVGMNVNATYYAPTTGVASYVSRIGIGSCTTACKVRYSLYKIMGSISDFS